MYVCLGLYTYIHAYIRPICGLPTSGNIGLVRITPGLVLIA